MPLLENLYVFLYHFWVGELGNLMCSYKRIMSPPGKSEVFLLHQSLLENIMCSRNLVKKVAPGKKEQIF